MIDTSVKRAVKAHITSGFRLNRTIAQLGYPSHQALTHGRGLDIGQDPVAIYHFAIAGWFFELDYLRRLRKRDEDHFAIAAHDCFNSDLFWKEMRELGGVDFEEFSVGPHLESTYVFARNPRDEKKMVFVNRVTFTSFIDFYTFDLFNGLHHGHAPSQCLCCGKYFLTSTEFSPPVPAPSASITREERSPTSCAGKRSVWRRAIGTGR